jgi:hypothetical protein
LHKLIRPTEIIFISRALPVSDNLLPTGPSLRKSSQTTAVREFIPLLAVLRVAEKMVAKKRPGTPGTPSEEGMKKI